MNKDKLALREIIRPSGSIQAESEVRFSEKSVSVDTGAEETEAVTRLGGRGGGGASRKSSSIAQFISDGRAAGKTESEMTRELLEAGWHMDIIARAMHGDPIPHRNLDPILDIKNQPIRRSVMAGGLLLIVALLLAAFA